MATTSDYLTQLQADKTNLVNNLTTKGVTASNTETFTSLVPKVLDIETGESDEWQRPSDWWDCETILLNAEERDGLKPVCVALIDDSEETTTFVNRYGVLTSDGSWYNNQNITHEWDTTKDKECSLGYKTRYFILYMNTAFNFPIPVNQSLEIVVGANAIQEALYGMIPSYGKYDNTSATKNLVNKKIISFKILERNSNVSKSAAGGFNSCPSIKYISISNLINISSAFANACPNLEQVSLPSLETISSSNSDKIKNIFTNCTSLKTISLPSLETISYSYIFQYCTSLKKINLPLLTTINGTSTFANCSSLKEANLPLLEGTLPNYTFSQCSSLQKVNLPKISGLNNSSFYSCSSLKEVNIPLVEEVSTNAFSNCLLLKEISIPLLTDLGDKCFYNCQSLESFTIPSTCTQVYSTAFSQCYSLNTLNIYNNWTINNLNLKDCPLTYTCLLDILSKLADVTGETTTYKITFGTDNLAKLTEEEIAIGTNKGWVIN